MKKLFSIILLAVFALGAVRAQTAFYTQDFSAGIPAGWTNTSTDKNNVSYTGTWKATLTGSHGSYSSGFKINSPTVANGFVIFDSDSLDSQPGSTQGAGPDPAPQNAVLTTSAINCTGHSNIILSFYHGYNLFSGDLYVYVSNGTSADTFFLSQNYEAQFADGGISQGTVSLPAIQERFDITNVAANQANVTISFNWVNANYYFWMIDDINLLDAPTSDMKINRAGFQSYSIYPLSQVDSMLGFARVIEQGSTPQPNAKVTTTVKFGGSPVFTDTSPSGIDMPVGIDSLLLGTNAFFPTSGLGRYSVAINVFSDSTDAYPADNIDTTSFQVTDSTYAMDLGASGGAWPLNDATLTPAVANDEYINLYFKVVNADTVTSITTSFAGGTGLTTAGSQVRATIYSLDPTADPTLAASYVPVVATEVKTLTAANLGTYGSFKNCVLQVDNTSGAAGAAVLNPGYYAVGVRGISGTVYMHQPQRLVYGDYTAQVTGGIVGGAAAHLYRNVFGYIRMNFGHNFNLLTCSWSRNPVTTPLRATVPVVFTPHTNATGAGITYSWTLTDTFNNQIATSANSLFNYTFPDNPGNTDVYIVCLTVHAGNDSTSYCNKVIVKSFGLGINDPSGVENIAIVPNPTSGKVTISADVTGPVSIAIVNMLGETVKSYNEDANGSFSKTYDVSGLASGIYLVKIGNNNTVVTRKLSVSK